jgi:hypothetical protein
MSRRFDPSEAVPRKDGFVYDCIIGDKARSAINIDVALDGITLMFPIGGPGHECISNYMDVSLTPKKEFLLYDIIFLPNIKFVFSQTGTHHGPITLDVV